MNINEGNQKEEKGEWNNELHALTIPVFGANTQIGFAQEKGDLELVLTEKPNLPLDHSTWKVLERINKKTCSVPPDLHALSRLL